MGWTYNTVDPDAPTIGPQITGVAVALTLISLVSVCLRMYVRLFMIRAAGTDDWIIVYSWFASAGFAIVTILQTKWGLGLKRIQDLPPEDVYNFGILQYIGAPFYITSILGFKLSLLFTYLRFVPKGTYQHIIWGIITACSMFHLAFLLVQINLCQPAAKQWDPTITWGSCLPGVPVYTSMASITIIFDLTVMLVPFPVLLKSQIQTRKKLVLLGLFGLGLFITVIQIIRIQTVKQLANYIDSAPLILWSTVENNLGIIVANVPTLAPLIKYYNERSRRGGTSTNGPASRRTGNGLGGNGYVHSRGTDVGSRHAMQNWKNKRDGLQPLDSGNHDDDVTLQNDGGSVEGHVSKGESKNNSTEFILEQPAAGTIVKKTEVTITRL
ncbi:hypothetical protein QBC46DRAFT_143905 [Diplogelasinospora grovesii]|uniref:Rhodopsin domain-containing protein n=1 Tax=Diplogelasinospora grovesii TaxID=303347 RepID=A0AAN6S3Y8_9PEZI|nr:hypothetical protein QBC46DRAFT_143905 [Diplogelasinospora grovesii]